MIKMPLNCAIMPDQFLKHWKRMHSFGLTVERRCLQKGTICALDRCHLFTFKILMFSQLLSNFTKVRCSSIACFSMHMLRYQHEHQFWLYNYHPFKPQTACAFNVLFDTGLC